MNKKLLLSLVLLFAVGGALTASAQTTTTPAQQIIQIGAAGKVLLRGTISSVAAGVITVNSWGGAWTVDVPSTAQVLPVSVNNDITQFKTGDFIGVQGTVSTSANWTINATLVRDWTYIKSTTTQTTTTTPPVTQGSQGLRAYNGVFGTVSAISGTTLTVTSNAQNGGTATTYIVDASSATVTKSGTASSVSAIAIGDTVAVQGTVNGTSVTATSIRDGVMTGGMRGNGNGVFGTVSAISGTTLTVTSNAQNGGTATTYIVDASSATVTKAGATSTLSAIAVGDTVMIQGTVSGTSITATTINDGVMNRTSGMFGRQGGQGSQTPQFGTQNSQVSRGSQMQAIMNQIQQLEAQIKAQQGQ